MSAAILDRRGALVVGGASLANVKVSPELVERALRMLDAVIRSAERLGHTLVSRTDSSALLIDSVLVPFAITESFRLSDAPPDAGELDRRRMFQERYPDQVASYGFVNPWMYRPTGKLSVSIGTGPMAGL